MAGNRVGARAFASVRDPWALLLSTFGGGAVWAFGDCGELLSIAQNAATTASRMSRWVGWSSPVNMSYARFAASAALASCMIVLKNRDD